ncbi:MAG: hypothetical protein QOH28_3997 [Actinomycetota bacterium]|nr:hypothetical protein [Actinomycetota bacterium]
MTTYDTQSETTQNTHAIDVPPAPPYDDGDEPDFTPRPRKRAHRLTYVLGGLALVAIGALGGIAIQKHEDHGSTTAASPTGAPAGAFAGGRGAGGGAPGAGGGAGGAGATVGTVKLIDGNNIYVTEANGTVVKVAVNAASQLTRTDPATIKDITPGESVIVRGATGTDGSVTATAVTASPAASAAG